MMQPGMAQPGMIQQGQTMQADTKVMEQNMQPPMQQSNGPSKLSRFSGLARKALNGKIELIFPKINSNNEHESELFELFRTSNETWQTKGAFRTIIVSTELLQT